MFAEQFCPEKSLMVFSIMLGPFVYIRDCWHKNSRDGVLDSNGRFAKPSIRRARKTEECSWLIGGMYAEIIDGRFDL